MLKDIVFEEAVENSEYETITLYFIAPKECIQRYSDNYKDAESTEISLEFPLGHIEPRNAQVEFSPTKDGEDYEWHDVNMPYEIIDQLLVIYGAALLNGYKAVEI